jgi:hypothetical protein
MAEQKLERIHLSRRPSPEQRSREVSAYAQVGGGTIWCVCECSFGTSYLGRNI